MKPFLAFTLALALGAAALPALAAQGQQALYTRGKLNVNLCTSQGKNCHIR